MNLHVTCGLAWFGFFSTKFKIIHFQLYTELLYDGELVVYKSSHLRC